MQINEVRREMSEFDLALEEYKQMVEFGPLVSDLVDAVLIKTRSEEDDIRFSCARALGKVTAMMPAVLAIEDIEKRKQKLIQMTKENSND